MCNKWVCFVLFCYLYITEWSATCYCLELFNPNLYINAGIVDFIFIKRDVCCVELCWRHLYHFPLQIAAAEQQWYVAQRGAFAPAALCRGRHFELNIPKIHEAVRLGCKSSECWHSNVGMCLLKSLTTVIKTIHVLNMNTVHWLALRPIEECCSLQYSLDVVCCMITNYIHKPLAWWMNTCFGRRGCHEALCRHWS